MGEHGQGGLSARDMGVILEVTRGLAAPFDLTTMLTAVTTAARQVLNAERSSVWLHDAGAAELVLKVSSDIKDVRIPVGLGLVGACARDRQIINVPDCYADPRFDAAIDKRSGFRTRCALTLPLVDHRDALVGVMQVLNRTDGVFDAADEALAAALAAQCAVALQRVQMTQALMYVVFQRSEVATRDWLGSGFDSDVQMLELINAGGIADSPVGRYLNTLRDHLEGPLLADVLCYLRLYTELSLRAKGLLMMRENGYHAELDDEAKASLAEPRYLEGSIGKTGLRALRPCFA